MYQDIGIIKLYLRKILFGIKNIRQKYLSGSYKFLFQKKVSIVEFLVTKMPNARQNRFVIDKNDLLFCERQKRLKQAKFVPEV